MKKTSGEDGFNKGNENIDKQMSNETKVFLSALC